MRVLLFISILLGGLRSFTATADVGCEAAANPMIQKLSRVTEVFIREGALTLDDLRTMIDGDEIRNPFLTKSKRPENSGFRAGMDKVIRAATSDTQAAKLALTNLQNQLTQTATAVESTKVATQALLLPNLINRINLPPGPRTVHWHRQASGELELGVYFKSRYELLIFSPYARQPRISRILTSGWDIPDNTEVTSSLFTSRRGQLLVAVAGQRAFQHKILIHDVARNSSVTLDVPERSSHISLFESADGKIRLVTMYRSEIKIYELDSATLKEIHSVRFSGKVESFEVVSKPNSRSLLTVWDSHNLQLFDLETGHSLRQFKTNDKILGAQAVAVDANDFAIAVNLATRRSESQVTFFTSNSPGPLTTGMTSETEAPGEWHLTADGRAYFPVGSAGSRDDGQVHVYEPLKLNIKRALKIFPPSFDHIVLPVFSAPSSSTTWSNFHWYEIDGQLLLGNAYSYESKIFPADERHLNPRNNAFRLFSLSSGQTLADFPMGDLGAYKFHVVKGGTDFVLVRETGLGKPLEIRDVLTGKPIPNEFLGAHNLSTLLVRNANGDLLFTSHYDDPVSQTPLDILRIMGKYGHD